MYPSQSFIDLSVPPTTNALSAHDRAELVRKSRKLTQLFGRTPALVDALQVPLPPEPAAPFPSRRLSALSDTELRHFSGDHLSFIDLDDDEDEGEGEGEGDGDGGGSGGSDDARSLATVDRDKEARRRQRDQLAKLHRFLGSRVPTSLVLGLPPDADADDLSSNAYPATAPTSAVATVPPPSSSLLASTHQTMTMTAMRRLRRRSSSATELKTRWFDDGDERVKAELGEREKAINVRRAVKMEKLFGVPPPQTLYHTRTATVGGSSPSSSPVGTHAHAHFHLHPQSQSQSHSRSRSSSRSPSHLHPPADLHAYAYTPSAGTANINRSSYIDKGKARATRTFNFSQPTRVSSLAKTSAGASEPWYYVRGGSGGGGGGGSGSGSGSRPGRSSPSESHLNLVLGAEDFPRSVSIDEPYGVGLGGGYEGDGGDPFSDVHRRRASSVYMQYRHSLISLGDIIDRDDKESIAEIHQYLTHATDLAPVSDTSPPQSRSPTPTLPSSPRPPSILSISTTSTSSSLKSLRRRSLPTRASSLSLASQYSTASTATATSIATTTTTATVAGQPAAMHSFQARRRRAAKLTSFFGVDYRDLIGDILDSIEHDVQEERSRGGLKPDEAQDLLQKLRKLKTKRTGTL